METKVTHTCNPDRPGMPLPFGKRGPGCVRCAELDNGAPARQLPGARYRAHKRMLDEARTRDIREHSCRQSGCGIVCTAFDW